MTSDAANRSIRIRASHIRQKLLGRNNTEFFRATLASISDEELIRRDAEHHAAKLAEIAERASEEKKIRQVRFMGTQG